MPTTSDLVFVADVTVDERGLVNSLLVGAADGLATASKDEKTNHHKAEAELMTRGGAADWRGTSTLIATTV